MTDNTQEKTKWIHTFTDPLPESSVNEALVAPAKMEFNPALKNKDLFNDARIKPLLDKEKQKM